LDQKQHFCSQFTEDWFVKTAGHQPTFYFLFTTSFRPPRSFFTFTMTPLPFLIWGSKGHGLVILELLQACGHTVVAVADNDPHATSILPNAPLLIGADQVAAWFTDGPAPPHLAAAIAIGGPRGTDRSEIARFLMNNAIPLPSLVHPAATVSPTATLGNGSQILANSLIAANGRLGPCTIVNHSANVDHECLLGANVHIGPGAVLCGCVRVDDNAFVGAGAVVLPGIRIGEGAVVGAGATVTKDVPPRSVVVGCPARTIGCD
jgi:sugar O-acyltransferase (sialic acid O-acetyltransferase NeuD family)